SICSMLIFCFSSRRRHTRFSRDWSSDVCSSDLRVAPGPGEAAHVDQAGDRVLLQQRHEVLPRARGMTDRPQRAGFDLHGLRMPRSEERRVGKGYRSKSRQEGDTVETTTTMEKAQ